MAENILEVRDLTVSFKKGEKTIKAVNGISFSAGKGEILGIAGESGCGKSLAALSIAGLLPQKANILSGEIIYKNLPLSSMSENELCGIRGKEISIIFQEYRQSLNPLVKAGRQIRETLDIRDSKDIINNKKRVFEILRRLGFDEPKKVYNAYPHQLSGGMCQRVTAAIAAIGRPQLLLADEPSTALDSESRERIFSLLAQMNRDYGTAIIVISHDLSVIQQFCSRYLVMYAGKIVEEGPSLSLFSPLHPYTKALCGAIPGKEKRGSNLFTIPGKVPSAQDNLTGCPFAPRCPKAQSVCRESFPPVKEIDNRKVYCHYPASGEKNE